MISPVDRTLGAGCVGSATVPDMLTVWVGGANDDAPDGCGTSGGVPAMPWPTPSPVVTEAPSILVQGGRGGGAGASHIIRGKNGGGAGYPI